MGKLFNLKAVLAMTLFALALSGCGGDDAFSGGGSGTTATGTGTGNGGGTGTPGSGAQNGVASSIAVSYPITNAVENLGAGFYSAKGSAIVVDEDGNIVPDGTEVRFKIIDSVKAKGTIVTGDGDGITGSVLTDTVPLLADGTASSFDAAYAYRGGGFRFIEPEDQVFLFNADKADKARSVATGTLAATTLNVTSAYANTYPNTTYTDGNTDYVVGASHIGADVEGVDENGDLYTGTISTVNGIANFAIVYPANVNTINVGCGSVPSIDGRYTPTASADVYLAAYVPNTDVATISQPCFSYITGGTLTPSPAALSSSGTVSVVFRDGGDTIPVSYASIGASVAITTNTGGLNVTVADTDVAPATTNKTKNGGFINYNVTVAGGASGDAATITFDAGDGITATVDVKIP